MRAGKRDAGAGALVSAVACGSGTAPLDQLAPVWEAVAPLLANWSSEDIVTSMGRDEEARSTHLGHSWRLEGNGYVLELNGVGCPRCGTRQRSRHDGEVAEGVRGGGSSEGGSP